jgi:hypothetical protein
VSDLSDVEGNVVTQIIEVPLDTDIPGMQQKIKQLEARVKQMESEHPTDITNARDKGFIEGLMVSTSVWIVGAILFVCIYVPPWTWF